MQGINKVTLIGYIGEDAKISEHGIATFSLATTEKYIGKDGEKKENTQWHKITAFKKLAEIAQLYVKKGCLVYIEGKLHTNKWTDKNNSTHYSTEIYARELQVLKHTTTLHEQKLPPSSPEPCNEMIDDDIPF